MTHDIPNYERLVRGVRRYDSPFVAPTYRLWLGPDHILQIRDSGYSESYKRFYFRDIQAIAASKTSGYQTRLVVHSALLVLCGLLGYLSESRWGWEGAGIALFGGAGLVCLVLFVLNVLRGPTCECTIYTGVHIEPLPALCRLRKTRRVMARLRLIIEGVQGALTPEAIQDKVAAAPPSLFTRKATAAAQGRAPTRHDDGRLHMALFASVLAGACLSGLDLFVHHVAKDLFDMFWLVSTLILAIVVTAKQSGSDIRLALGRIVWVVLFAIMFQFIIGVVMGIVISITTEQADFNAFDATVRAAMTDSPFFQVYAVLFCAIYALLGVLGLLRLWDFRRAHSEPSASGT